MRKTKEDAERTRQRIIEVALQVFGQRGFSGTTLENVAREAQVTRGAIYWHFRNKIELYEALMAYSQEPINDLVRRADQRRDPALQVLEWFMREWLRYLRVDDKYRSSFEILLNKTELTDTLSNTLNKERRLTEGVLAMLERLFARARREGTGTPGLSARQAALAVYTFLMGITQTWLFNPALLTLERDAARLVKVFREGLLNGTEKG